MTDFCQINKILLRPIYPFEGSKRILESLTQEDTYVAALGMLQGYFQVPLDEKTSWLTVFITPWGKYRYSRAPMGLSPSSDLLNAITSALVDGLVGIEKSMDDFLAHVSSIKALEGILRKFFDYCKKLGVKMSTKKFQTGTRVKFGGHIINTRTMR